MLIVFSGYNQRAVIAFLRTLRDNEVNNYAIIASSDEDPILLTDYVYKVVYVRKNKQLSLPEIWFAIQQAYDTYKENSCMIVPSTEALNRFLLQNRCFFEAKGCTIPLVDEEMYASISDKEKFWKICDQNGLCVPELITCNDGYRVPFVAKPKRYFASDGRVYSPVIVRSEKEYTEFMGQYDTDDFDLQEYISGTSYYLLFFFSKTGAVYKFSQENYMQQSGGKSMIAAGCSTLHLDETITGKYEELFLQLGFTGLIMIELRKKEKDYYMIEANPRFWGPSQLFCDAGYNLFEYFLCDYGIIARPQTREIDYHMRYFWSGGLKGRSVEDEDCMWLGNGKQEVTENLDSFLECDIYKRNDTIKVFEQESGNRYGKEPERIIYGKQ